MKLLDRSAAHRLACSHHALAESVYFMVGRTRELSAIMADVRARYDRAHAEFQRRMAAFDVP